MYITHTNRREKGLSQNCVKNELYELYDKKCRIIMHYVFDNLNQSVLFNEYIINDCILEFTIFDHFSVFCNKLT